MINAIGVFPSLPSIWTVTYYIHLIKTNEEKV